MLFEILDTSSVPLLAALTLFLVVAGLIKGLIGVGMPIIALPLLSVLIDMRAAVMLLAVPLILSNIPQALEGGRMQFTKEASLFLVASSALLALLLGSSNTFDRSDLLISASALAPVAIGMVFGQKLRNRIPADVFKKAVLTVVLLSGLFLTGRVFAAL